MTAACSVLRFHNYSSDDFSSGSFSFIKSSTASAKLVAISLSIINEPSNVAENEKKLSFVNETTIANCFMYGDMLTKLVFDIRNEEFKKIMNCKVKCIGDAMGEYECCKLLPEKNYSLSDVNTIRLIFSMVKEKKQLISIFFHGYGNLESRLRGYGFLEAADLVHYLNEEFNKDNDILLKRGVELIDTYLSIN